MTDPTRRTTRYHSLRTSRLVLARMSPLVRLGLWGIGVSVFLKQVEPLVSDIQFTWGERRVMGIVALITVGGFGLGGWVAGRLFKASAELIDLLIDGAEVAWRTADLIELQMVPALGRIAGALERQAVPPRDDPRDRAVATIRQAIASQRWEQAARLVTTLARDFPGATEAESLSDELENHRSVVIQRLREALESGRADDDPDRVIDARDALTQHLRGEPLHDLDQQVVRWLVSTIQRRVRSGMEGEAVARLAARIADSFGDTAEGTSLRAALPSLRRKAGLCPQCGRKTSGNDEACPRCLARGAAAAPLSPTGPPRPKDSP